MPTEQPFPAALRPAPPSSATAPTRLGVEALEARDVPSVGGGFTNHGLDGVYYSDPNFANAAFARRDVRLDFDWETAVKPGGSNSPGFRDVGTDNYSAKWTGQLVARFSEAYTFSGFADDVFKLELKPAGATTWTTVVDQPNYTGREFAGTTNLVAGQAYDLQASFKEFGGAAAVSLKWASPSTPREVIDPLDQAGANNPDSSTTFVDIVKGARNSWGWGVGVDADGWPTGQTEYIFQESLNQGLGLDPLMRGKLQFSFRGKADLNLFGNVDYASLSYSYDAATNTTAGSFVTRDSGSNASAIRFLNPTRNGQSGGPGGLTAFKLLRPTTPDATTTYAPGTLFTTQEKDYVRHYTVVRHQYVANQQKEWGDRTLPHLLQPVRRLGQPGGGVRRPVEQRLVVGVQGHVRQRDRHRPHGQPAGVGHGAHRRRREQLPRETRQPHQVRQRRRQPLHRPDRQPDLPAAEPQPAGLPGTRQRAVGTGAGCFTSITSTSTSSWRRPGTPTTTISRRSATTSRPPRTRTASTTNCTRCATAWRCCAPRRRATSSARCSATARCRAPRPTPGFDRSTSGSTPTPTTRHDWG